MTNIFDEVKRLVSARDAAEHYDFSPNRSGFVCCPFHGEHTPSLKLFNNGTWHCFGCHSGGSGIDFVAQLFDLSPLDAIRKLNEDFRLGLPLDQPPNKAQQKAAQQRQKLHMISDKYEKWRDDLINQLNGAYRIGHLVLLNWPDKLTEQEILAVKWHSSLEYWSDLLLSGDIDKEIEVFRDKKGIEKLCRRILKNTQMKSNAA